MSAEATSKSPGTSKKKAVIKKGVPVKSSAGENGAGLVRDSSRAMNCQTILTGFYGSRGERIKHTVSKGALQMPAHSLDVIEAASEGFTALSEYRLPGLDSVVRPLLDPTLDKIVLTELASERVAVPQQPPPPIPGQMYIHPPQVTYVHVIRTRAQNRTITRLQANPAERIRGGGNEDTPMQIDGQLKAFNRSSGLTATASTTAPVPSTGVPLVGTLSTAVPPAPINSNPTATTGAVPRVPTVPGAKPTIVSNQTPSQTYPPKAAVAANVPAAGGADKVVSGSTVAPRKIIPIKSLAVKPNPQWTQHKPGPNDETITPADQLTPKPDWYKNGSVTEIERTMLPEWFDSSAPHRTPEKYIKTRERIITMSDTIKNRNVTNSMIRRSIEGDAGSLQRLRNFLVNWGFINEDGINDSAPTSAALRHMRAVPLGFDQKLGDELLEAVVRESKRRKLQHEREVNFLPIDWEEVAKQVGHGVTSKDCERNFLSLQIKHALPAAPVAEKAKVPPGPVPVPNKSAPTVAGQIPPPPAQVDHSKEAIRQEFIEGLLDGASAEVVKKVTEAAFQASPSNMEETQSAALLGLVASRAVEQARSHENALSAVLSQLVNQRMKKLENRMAMIDDVEGILEAERVALELERRDLYTARCRHWYGGA
jgi:SWI/SNF related-matrix-associated actin-dependent regulator of chromatin subfamily C